LPDNVGLALTIARAVNKHFCAHFLQPVQASSSVSTANFFQFLTCRLSRWSGHTATHQPHPVQRELSTLGHDPGRLRRIPAQHESSSVLKSISPNQYLQSQHKILPNGTRGMLFGVFNHAVTDDHDVPLYGMTLERRPAIALQPE
jgi:hypothetical protein